MPRIELDRDLAFAAGWDAANRPLERAGSAGALPHRQPQTETTTMRLTKPLLAGLAVLALTTPTFAAAVFSCEGRGDPAWTEIIDGGVIVHDVYGEVNRIVGGTPPGPNGWDGVGGQCTKPGSSRIWVGPRNADGTCMTPASLTGFQGGAIFGKVVEKVGEDVEQLPDTEIDHPSTEEHRKVILNPVYPHVGGPYLVVGPWKDGTC